MRFSRILASVSVSMMVAISACAYPVAIDQDFTPNRKALQKGVYYERSRKVRRVQKMCNYPRGEYGKANGPERTIIL